MEKNILSVSGMSCGHCVHSIESNVGGLKGVSSVKVHLRAGKVEVEYFPSEITLQVIKETIENQGYDVAQQ